jgi:peptidyl-prolyl cis-trans isomerase B (cyclophilin B)
VSDRPDRIDLDHVDPATLEAAMVTSKGTMVITFLPDKAPGHVHNFLKLAQQGFYDGLTFHRVIRNFMVQGGCPNTKKGATGQPGTGRPPGPGLRAEFNDTKHVRGVLSMARSRDPNSAGSQFFIVHAEHATQLDGQYTAFGRVEQGLDVLDAIAATECAFGPGGENSSPKERIEIQRVELRPGLVR